MKAAPDLVTIARELGFARAAVVPIEAPRRHHLYESWLAGGKAGEMHYLAAPEHVAQRGDLRAILDSARSLIVVALAYDRGVDVPVDRLRGKIARYARGEDYHLVMRDKLVLLADRLATEFGAAIASRPCVDSAPVLEREWAVRGGLGWFGKNTMLLSTRRGSWFFLAEIVTDLVLAPDVPTGAHCGRCTACLEACPTGAIILEHDYELSYYNRRDAIITKDKLIVPPPAPDHDTPRAMKDPGNLYSAIPPVKGGVEQ